MFWKKKPAVEEPSKPKVEKLPKPKDIPELVGRYLIRQMKKDPDWVWKLKGVVRQRSEDKDAFDFRVFDEAQVAAKKVAIKDYTSLDEHPDLILYQGRFDKKSGEVQIIIGEVQMIEEPI
jgi:hypothetical protein